MKNFFFKATQFLDFKWNLVIFLFLSSYSISHSQDIKKEIHIPFPETPILDESILLNKKKKETIIEPEKKPVKDFINIPFPDDKIEKKNQESEIKKEESEKPSIEDKKPDSSTNIELPLEKLFVFPEINSNDAAKTDSKEADTAKLSETKDTKKSIPAEEIKPNPVAETKRPPIPRIEPKNETKSVKIESKNTRDIGKALVGQDKPTKIANSKTPDKPILKKSKITGLADYSKDELPADEVEAKKASPKKVEAKTTEVTANDMAITNLPNAGKGKSIKGKDKTKADESAAPYERSKFYLNRDDKSSATPELNTASSSDGEKSNLAKMDQIRLLASERKKSEAKNIIDGISDPEFRFKGLYELAVGLENSAKGDKKLKEEAIPFHLTIITEATKTDSILPKSLWALSHLLFTIGDHTPALDHLSEIILNHSNTEFADDAIYLSGRIYEESTSIRNLTRAKKYYELFIKNESKKHFKNSIYLPFVKKRLELLEN